MVTAAGKSSSRTRTTLAPSLQLVGAGAVTIGLLTAMVTGIAAADSHDGTEHGNGNPPPGALDSTVSRHSDDDEHDYSDDGDDDGGYGEGIETSDDGYGEYGEGDDDDSDEDSGDYSEGDDGGYEDDGDYDGDGEYTDNDDGDDDGDGEGSGEYGEGDDGEGSGEYGEGDDGEGSGEYGEGDDGEGSGESGEEPDPPVGEEPDPPAGEEPDPPTGEEPDPPSGEEPDPPTGEEPDPPTGEEPEPPGEPAPSGPQERPSGGYVPTSTFHAGPQTDVSAQTSAIRVQPAATAGASPGSTGPAGNQPNQSQVRSRQVDALAVQLTPPAPVNPDTALSVALSNSAIGPGGHVVATGVGCAPAATVNFSIDGHTVGNTVAGPQGSFESALTTSTLGVGRHQVTAACGGDDRNVALDVVLVSRIGTGAATTTLILIFMVTGGWFFGHRLFSPTVRRI